MTERFTVDSDGKWWDRITHEYVTLDNLFRTVEELDNKLESKQHTINEMAKTIRIYDDGYIDLNKKYKKLKDENEQLKSFKEQNINEYLKLKEVCNECKKENEQLKQFIKKLTTKGTGRIDLASGYSYNVNAVLTGYRGDVE